MFNILFPFLVLSSGSLLGCLKNKKYEEILPITTLSIIIVLYVFYILNILTIGFYMIITFAILFYLLFFISIIKTDNKRTIIKKLLTPGFFIYLVLYIFIFYITKNNEILLWDELRLWGAYPKILYYDSSLQLGDNAQLMNIMRSYNPGMPLFQYFILKCIGSFKESFLFFAYSILWVSTIIPITKNINWKKWYLIPIFLIIILLLPLAFFNSSHDGLIFYKTIFIEPIISVVFAYSLYLTTKNILNERYNYLYFILITCVLTLLKDSGILFSLMCYISFVLNYLLKYRKEKKFSLMNILLPVIIIISIFYSWKLVQNIYENNNMYTSEIRKNEIVTLLKEPNQQQKDILNKFKKAINTKRLIKTTNIEINNYFTFKNLFTLLIIVYLLFIFVNRNKNKEITVSIIMFFITSIMYILGILFIYLFSIYTVASFSRYMSVIFSSGLILLFLLIVDKILIRRKLIHIGTLMIFLMLLVFVYIGGIKNPNSFLLLSNEKSKKYSNTIVDNNITANDSIALLFTKEQQSTFGYTIYHHQIYMDLIDEGFRMFDTIFIDDKLNEEILKYDYIYFISVNTQDIEVFNNNINVKEKIDESTLFRVNDDVLVNVK